MTQLPATKTGMFRSRSAGTFIEHIFRIKLAKTNDLRRKSNANCLSSADFDYLFSTRNSAAKGCDGRARSPASGILAPAASRCRQPGQALCGVSCSAFLRSAAGLQERCCAARGRVRDGPAGSSTDSGFWCPDGAPAFCVYDFTREDLAGYPRLTLVARHQGAICAILNFSRIRT